MYRIPVVASVAVVAALLAAWTVFVSLARLSGFHATIWAPPLGAVPADKRGDLVRDTLAVVALMGAVLAAIYAYRKQRIEEASGYRADSEALSKRYQDAASQLGHERAAVRLAGVYALGRLADDWAEQRQTCVDVLCAYLRMPPEHADNGDVDMGDQQVRRSIQTLLRQHMQADSAVSWSALRLDLSWAMLDQLDLSGSVFRSQPDFSFAHFGSICRFDNATFYAGARFNGIVVEQHSLLRLGDVTVIAGDVQLTGSTVAKDGTTVLSPTLIAEGASLSAFMSDVQGSVHVLLQNQDVTAGGINIGGLRLLGSGDLNISGLETLRAGVTSNAPHVDATRARVSDASRVRIAGELLTAGIVTWDPSHVDPTAEVDMSPTPTLNQVQLRFP